MKTVSDQIQKRTTLAFIHLPTNPKPQIAPPHPSTHEKRCSKSFPPGNSQDKLCSGYRTFQFRASFASIPFRVACPFLPWHESRGAPAFRLFGMFGCFGSGSAVSWWLLLARLGGEQGEGAGRGFVSLKKKKRLKLECKVKF